MVYKNGKSIKLRSKQKNVNKRNKSRYTKKKVKSKRRMRKAKVKFPNKKLTKKQKARRELYLDKRDFSPSLSIKTRINDMDSPLH